ncbi:MAG: hypothetical protein HKN13_09975 [Rhodothermales bacterium]|nr:hypothetical protein [Rhodothermales bacterium]
MSGQARPIARYARRIVLRTSVGWIRDLWLIGYRIVIATAVVILRHRTPNAAVYARGSFGVAGNPIPGLSDIDLVIVIPDTDEPTGTAARRPCARWARVSERVAWLRKLVSVGGYEDRELADVTRATVFTHDLDKARATRALYAGSDPLRDHLTARAKPGIPAPMSDWRLLAGPERRPVRHPRPDDAWIAAWLDLQCWWRYAFWATCGPTEPHVAYLGVKLVAEPVRILLWLRHGEQIHSRRDALKLGLRLVPEEADSIQAAIRTSERLERSPEAQLPERIGALVRLSSLVANEIAQAALEHGTTSVSLSNHADTSPPALAEHARHLGRIAGQAIDVLPVADWRARTVPGEPVETMLVLQGVSASDPEVLVAAGSTERPGVVVAIPAGNVLVLPTLDRRGQRRLLRGMLRAIQCEQSDPVTFSLLAGNRDALFPEIPGWSALDSARRAVAEHSAHLADRVAKPDLHDLLVAARAAIFLETLQRGEPRLALDGSSICSELGQRGGVAATIASAARDAWRARNSAGVVPDSSLMRELLSVVRALPAYSSQ